MLKRVFISIPVKPFSLELHDFGNGAAWYRVLPNISRKNPTKRAKVTTVKRGNENKIVWVCSWKERPPIGWILNLSPIYMCPFCDAPVAEVEEVTMLSCGFCGGAFSKSDAL